MIRLAFPFTRDDFTHALILRAGDVCLVERTNERTSSVHWEVVRLMVEPAKAIEGRLYREHERYPSNELWGERGWTFTSLAEAMQKYRSLVEMRAQKGGSEAEETPEASPPAENAPAAGGGRKRGNAHAGALTDLQTTTLVSLPTGGPATPLAAGPRPLLSNRSAGIAFDTGRN